jgi:hypothetical protein
MKGADFRRWRSPRVELGLRSLFFHSIQMTNGRLGH